MLLDTDALKGHLRFVIGLESQLERSFGGELTIHRPTYEEQLLKKIEEVESAALHIGVGAVREDS